MEKSRMLQLGILLRCFRGRGYLPSDSLLARNHRPKRLRGDCDISVGKWLTAFNGDWAALTRSRRKKTLGNRWQYGFSRRKIPKGLASCPAKSGPFVITYFRTIGISNLLAAPFHVARSFLTSLPRSCRTRNNLIAPPEASRPPTQHVLGTRDAPPTHRCLEPRHKARTPNLSCC